MTMTGRPCDFCAKEMAPVPLIVGKHTIEVSFCYNCKYEYASWGGAVTRNLYATINDKMYRWSIEDADGVARLWYVGEPGEPGVRPNRKLRVLKSFAKFYPTITPTNIERKLKFILVFL